jgi:hypothetical protein
VSRTPVLLSRKRRLLILIQELRLDDYCQQRVGSKHWDG